MYLALPALYPSVTPDISLVYVKHVNAVCLVCTLVMDIIFVVGGRLVYHHLAEKGRFYIIHNKKNYNGGHFKP
jgi:hypothetical protein